jgi:hypothetical protein
MKHDYIETHLAKHDYIEGQQATANFERLAKAVFQAKKTAASPSALTKKQASKHKSGKGKA